MAESFDVVVVGARCAGAPLAALLARQGLRVLVLERASFPRDTLSSHVFQADALAFLDRLGVSDRVRETGAYLMGRTRSRMQDVEFTATWPQRPGDIGGIASVRRFVLDPILAEAAAESGAEVRMGTRVTGLIEDKGRVCGVRAVRNGNEAVFNARLVVGADGRNSTLASLVGARKYNVTPNQRFAYWGFFEGADAGSDPPFVFQRWDARFMTGCPCDSGLYQVIMAPELRELPGFRADLEGSFMRYATSCEPVAEMLRGARRVGKLLGMLRWEGFFREASGSGWVLVGDAGHFKDFSAGRGIADAFRQVEALSPVIADAVRSSPDSLDHALADWGRWRDKDFAEHYWFAVDFGRAGPLPTPQPEFIKRLLDRGKVDQLLDVLNHRAMPSKVITAPRILGATGRLLMRGECDRRALVGEVAGLISEDMRHRRLNWRPVYAAPRTSADAGATEVEDNAALA
jgi:flavin-dependent dehydrogenase